MRITLVSHFFPPARNAGTENYTLGLASTFLERGHEVSVICAGDWEDGPAYWNGVTAEEYEGIELYRVNLNWKKARDPNLATFDSLAVETWMAQHLRTIQPDIVHVTSTMTLGIGVLRAPYKEGIPLVTTLMDFWFICPRTILVTGNGELCNGVTTEWECMHCLLTSSRLYERGRTLIPQRYQEPLWRKVSKTALLTRQRGARGLAIDIEHRKHALTKALELPNLILSHSHFVKQMYSQTGVSDRVVHLPNGHDFRWLSTHASKSKSSSVRFGYMGQLVPAKGLHILVEAFQLAGFKPGVARLDIWGDLNQDQDYTRKLRERIGDTEEIGLRGRFDRSRLAEVLAQIDVLVVPSLWYENAPLVIYEAFATKTPVIATNLGGMSEAVTHSVDGLLFDRGDANSLSGEMKHIIDEPGLLERLVSGISPVKDIQDEVSELEALYRQLK